MSVLLLALQQDPSGGTSFTFPSPDWGKLVPDLVGLFLNAISDTVANAMLAIWDGFWKSGLNVVGQTPEAMTIGFGPTQFYLQDMEKVAYGVIFFALVLLGLATMLGASNAQHEIVVHIVGALILAGVFVVFVHRAYLVVNQAATGIGRADLSQLVPQGSEHHVFESLVLLLILLFYAIDLVLLSVERIVILAVLTPFGVLAMLLRAIPQLRYVSAWWARTYFGLLFAQLPVVMALTIGLQMAKNAGGIATFVYAIAFLKAARSLYRMFYDGMHVGLGQGGIAMGGLFRGLRFGGGGGGGAAPAAQTAANNTAQDLAVPYGY